MTSPLTDVSLHLVESIDDAMELKRWLGERHDGPLAIDTESGGLSAWHHRLRLVQVGDKRTGWAIPWERWGGVAMEIMNAWEGDWVAHNGVFDWKFISRHTGFQLPWHKLDDTLTMARLDDPTRFNGLKPLASSLIDRRAVAGQKALDEGMADNRWTWDTVPINYPPYWLYSSLDPVLTAHLDAYFRPRVEAQCPEAYDLERAANRICTAMMIHGLQLDVPYVEKSIADFDAKAAEIRKWLHSAHQITSPKSGGQLRRAFERLNQDIVFWTDKNAPQFDKEALAFYEKSGQNDAVKQLAELIRAVRHIEDIRDRYSAKFLEVRDAADMVHCNINVMGARTGRMSISDPALQQLPRDDKVIRGSFVPRPGHVFVSCDLDQVEARLAAHFSRDPGLLEAFREADEGGGDFFCGVASEIFGEPIVKGDPRRQLTKNTVYGCVPLDYRILTRNGWRAHDEVSVGDETIGYDPNTKRAKWTRITAVHHYDSAELVRISSGSQSYVTTPNHRWYGEKRVRSKRNPRTETGFFTTGQLTDDVRLLLAAPLESQQGIDITEDEAAVLGWLLSDGCLRVEYTVSGPAQSGGRRRAVTGQIRQSEKKHAHVIDELLGRTCLEHRRYCPAPDRDPGYVVWQMGSESLRDLVRRAGLYDAWPDAVQFAASLTSAQAEAMLKSMLLADGDPFIKTKSWQLDLVSVLTYMTGRVPRQTWRDADTYGWGRQAFGHVRSVRPVLTGQRIRRERVPDDAVWCVTTELGTWTMRVPEVNGSRIVLTGNSIYGAGVETMARTAGVRPQQMGPVKEAFDARFPGLKQMSDEIIREARQYSRPTTFTSTGRPLIADEGREHTQLPNAKIQGTAAEYMKRCLVNLESAGLSEYACLPIHDEVLLEVPVDMAEDALRTVEECMTDRENYAVPLTAGGSILSERWAKT